MALLLTLIVISVAVMLLGGLTVRVISHSNQVERFTDYEKCFLGVESAVAESIGELESGSYGGDMNAATDGLIGLASWQSADGMPTFASDGLTPVSLDGLGGIEYFAYAQNWGTDNIDNNGNGNVDFDEEGYFSVYAAAQSDLTERAVQVVLFGTNVNVWNNAIFAGTGGSSGLINGNVSVHGSVHLLGDDLPEGDIAAIISLDVTGTAGIYNNYDAAAAGNAASPGVLARVPDLPTTMWNGEEVESLSAKLRVKRGLVSMGGNSTVGAVDAVGDATGLGVDASGQINGVKETVIGTFVTHGWTGNSVTPDGDRGDPSSVFSDNGWDNLYDLGDKVPFPTYADDGGTNHLDYFLEQDAAGAGFHSVKQGDISITTTKSYYWNATTGLEVVNGSPGAGAGASYMPTAADLANPASTYYNDYYIWFNAADNRMYVNGRVAVDGNISFAGQGNDKTINYTGRGSILTYDADGSGNGGDVVINTGLLTMNANGTTADSFPGYADSATGNVLGLMAEDTMYIGQSSQLEIMGGFYAQNEITIDKQTVIMGTIVSNFFNLTGQVPRIYQVPDLPKAWDDHLRMIGWRPIFALTPIAWHELNTNLLES